MIVSYITTGLVPTTVLITQSPASTTDDATLGQSRTAGSKGGVSGGAIAGIVIGVIGGLAAVITALVWFFCRRRRRDQERSRNSSFVAERVGPSSSGQQSNSIPSRQVSQMSQAGLLGSKAPRINTAFGGAGSLGLGSPTDPGSSTADRRSVGTDQRLNPWAIYKQDDQKSSVSLQDDRDYSRQLRVCDQVQLKRECFADMHRSRIPMIDTLVIDLGVFANPFASICHTLSLLLDRVWQSSSIVDSPAMRFLKALRLLAV